MVNGAVKIAGMLGVGDFIIGLTIVAFGTSLPELSASIVAIRKRDHDVAVGNVVGSSIFNILGIVPLLALLTPDGLRISYHALLFDLPIMAAASLVCLPIFISDYRISRWEGLIMLLWYTGYMVFLVLDNSHSYLLKSGRTITLWFIIVPLVVIGIVILTRKRTGDSLHLR